MAEYMHSSSFDGADKYGKDTFLIIKYLGKGIMPTLFRIKRLIDKKQMGTLFKVLFATNKKNNFSLGFEND